MPLSGKLTSLFFASASVGGMLFPWLVGQLIDARGALVMPPSLLCLVIISAFIIAGIIGYTAAPSVTNLEISFRQDLRYGCYQSNRRCLTVNPLLINTFNASIPICKCRSANC